MKNVLFVGFKGKNNASAMLVEQLCSEHVLLTNSFAGLKRDIDSIGEEYDHIVMFGVDKNLSSTVRLEKCAAKDGIKLTSNLDLDCIECFINNAGISTVISDNPTAYLCNEAYWYALRKFGKRAVFIHIPTIKHADENFMEAMKTAMQGYYVQSVSAKIPYEKISFPEHEYDSIQNYLNNLGHCYTTRVYKEVGKYKSGQLYQAPWGDILKIEEVQTYRKVSDRPFYDEMSDDEKAEIRRYSEDMGLPYEFIRFSLFEDAKTGRI